MPWTDDELQSLMGGPTPSAPLSGIPDLTWGETLAKRGKQIANIVPQTASNLFQDTVGLYAMGRPDQVTPSDIQAAGSAIPKFDVGPTTGITDVALNSVVPQLASWAIPYGEALKGAKLAGAGGVLAEGLAQGGANLLTNAGEGTQGNPISSGIMGTASGIVQAALPRFQRALPLAAISALDYAKTGDAWQAGGNFIGNMLPGAFKASDITAAKLAPNSLDEIASSIGLNPQSAESPIQPPITPSWPPPELSGLKLSNDQGPLAPLQQVSNGEIAPLDLSPNTSGMRTTPYNLTPANIPPDVGPSGLQLAEQPTSPISSGLQLESPESRLRDLQSFSPVESEAPLSGLKVTEDQTSPLQALVPPETQAPIQSEQLPEQFKPSSAESNILYRSHNSDFRTDSDLLNNEGMFLAPNKQSALAYSREGTSLETYHLNPDSIGYSTIENKHRLADRLGVVSPEEKSSIGLVGQPYHTWLDTKLANYFRSRGYDHYTINDNTETIALTKKALLEHSNLELPKTEGPLTPLANPVDPQVQAPSLAPTKTSQDIWDDKTPTTPIEGTPKEVQAIRDAYNNQAQKTGQPNVAISDVLADAEIDPERGKGIISDLYNKGEVPQFSKGDWSLASEDKRMGGMRIPSSGESPELNMRMAPQSSNDFTAQVKQAALEAPNKYGPKALISEVYPIFKKNTGSDMSMQEFKENLAREIPKKGGIPLSRIDWYAKGMNAPELAASEMNYGSEIYHAIDTHQSISSPVESATPTVMTPSGDFMDIQPRQEGPHIISTVLDEGDGQYLSGENWNDPHQKGDNSIFNQQVENATGLGKSAFLVKDENGLIRVTGDRVEAGQIAEAGGQRGAHFGEPLQSEDLVNTKKTDVEPTTPQESIANEKAQTQTENKSLEEQLRANVVAAKAANDWVGIRIASRKLQDFLEVNKPDEAAAREAKVASLSRSDIPTGGNVKGMKRSLRQGMFDVGGQQGSISPELATVLAVGGIGAAIGYQQSKGDIGSTLAVGVFGIGLGFGGVRAIKALRESVGPEAKIASTKLVGASLKQKMQQLATNTMRTPGGMAVYGRGGIWANSVRAAEGLTGLSGTPFFRDAKILADGYIAHQLEVMSGALEESRPYAANISTGFQEASAKYLRGQLADQTQVEALIKAGGGVTNDAFEALSKNAKQAYPEKWIVTNDLANTQGQGVEVYRVTNQAKSQLNKMQQTALAAVANSPDDKEFMKFILQSRESIDNIMQVVHDGLPPGLQRNKVLGTMGQYMSRSYAIFTDPGYYPEESKIQNAMSRLAKNMEEPFLKANATTAGTPGTVPIQYNGQTYYLSSADKAQWDNLHTPESLRSLVGQYIQQIKQIAAGKSQGLVTSDSAQLGTSLFTARKELDEVTQSLLGTHLAPTEMVQNTINKLIPTARASHFMSSLITMADERTGLSHAYSSEIEYNKAINDIKSNLRQASLSPVETQANQTKLQELSSYVPISGNDPKFGIFQGSYVSRMAHDQLAGYNGPFGILDNAIGKGLSQFNQIVKDTHLVMNPVTQVRNIMQIPMFLAMGNAATNPEAWKSAYQAMKEPLSLVGRRLTLNGVFSGNPVHGEFNHSLEQLLSGDADRSIFGMIKKGYGMASKLYAMPDNFVRASVYLAEEARAMKKFGVSESDLANAKFGDGSKADKAMQQARLFMSRRTLDYANVPTWVKAGRQIPFVSMYLSYTHEILRVAKNMAIDAAKGDFKAGATLAGIASTPFLLQNMAENKLSPADKADWDRANAVSAPYSRYRFKIPLSRNAGGTFNYLDITPLSHFSDFQMMGRALVHHDLPSVGAVNPFFGTDNTPLLSLLSEQVTGQDAHTGRTYRNISDRALAMAREIVPPHTPGLGYEYTKDVPESFGGDLGVTNLKNGRTNTITGMLTRHLSGVDFTQVNPELAERAYVGQAKEQIANERQYLMDTLKTEGLSEEAKQRATERFVGAVHHITEQMQTRLQLQ